MRAPRDQNRHRVNRHARRPELPKGTPIRRSLWRVLRYVNGSTIDTEEHHSLQLAGLIEWERSEWRRTNAGAFALKTGRYP